MTNVTEKIKIANIILEIEKPFSKNYLLKIFETQLITDENLILNVLNELIKINKIRIQGLSNGQIYIPMKYQRERSL